MIELPAPAVVGLGRSPHRRRHASTTLHVTGIALAAVSLGMLACAGLEALTTGRDTAALAVSGLLAGTTGGLLWYLTRPGVIRKRQIFATVGWTWILTTLVALCSAVIVALLWIQGGLSLGSSIRAGVFNAVSLGTSTGFGSATVSGSPGDYVTWVAGAQLVLLFLMVVGRLEILPILLAVAPHVYRARVIARAALR